MSIVISAKISISPDHPIFSMFDHMNNMERIFKTVAQYMRKVVVTHFRDQRGKDGAWPALSPTTLASRTSGGGGGKILIDNGTLMASISGRGGVMEVGEDFAMIGTTITYAPYHDQPNNSGGTGSRSGRLPKRDFMFLDDKDVDDINILINDYILKGRTTIK